MVHSFCPLGVDGILITVEVDIRRGLPGFDMVGLPGSAVRESRDRVRSALRNSGFVMPGDRVLVNLSPADVPKSGAWYDLSIAMALLVGSGQLPVPEQPVLALGELELSGRLRPVRAVLGAVAAARCSGVETVLVPRENLAEAWAAGAVRVVAADTLAELVALYSASDGAAPSAASQPEAQGPQQGFWPGDAADGEEDLADLEGMAMAKRALELAAAGGHHLFLYGPPGTGKTMAARRLPGLLPDLDRQASFEATKVHSAAGSLGPWQGLLRRPPFRQPHHTASAEGMVGGGRQLLPGELSLAHRGVLFLDEAPEFRRDVLQALREPLERGRIFLTRAGQRLELPARVQLVMTANNCPCGKLGKEGSVCLCSRHEVERYWKRLGAPLFDRIDIRVPSVQQNWESLFDAERESSATVRARVQAARKEQARRLDGSGIHCNAQVPASRLRELCSISNDARDVLLQAARKLGLSSRAIVACARLARTAADLEAATEVNREHMLEAIQFRRQEGPCAF